MSLSPDIRERIYEQERIRIEAQARIREEIRLRQQRTALILRAFMVLLFFSVGYFTSDYYLKRSQTIPEVGAPAQAAGFQVSQAVLEEIAAALRPYAEGDVCVRAIDRPRRQIKATIELVRDLPRDAVRRIALAGAKTVGATLRKHGFAVPAQVEAFSPRRWYGTALYDSDTLKITWDTCPGRCEGEGTRYVRRCRD